MILGIDPKVDFAFKRVFGDPRNSEILIHFLNREGVSQQGLDPVFGFWRSFEPCRAGRDE